MEQRLAEEDILIHMCCLMVCAKVDVVKKMAGRHFGESGGSPRRSIRVARLKTESQCWEQWTMEDRPAHASQCKDEGAVKERVILCAAFRSLHVATVGLRTKTPSITLNHLQ